MMSNSASLRWSWFRMLRAHTAHIFLVLACLTAFAAHGFAAERLIKLAHPNRNDPLDNATGAMATVFKNLVESGSGGGIHVDIYPEGQLGSDSAAVELVDKNVIQSAISTIGGIAQRYPLIQALDVPFAFSAISDTYAVFDGPFGQDLAHFALSSLEYELTAIATSDKGANASDRLAEDEVLYLVRAFVGIQSFCICKEAREVVVQDDPVAAKKFPSP